MIDSAPSQSASIWSEISADEIALFVAGIVFTIALLGGFIVVMIRASREKK